MRVPVYFLVLFVLSLIPLGAKSEINKIFVAAGTTSLPDLPINEGSPWSNWIGKDKLAFSKGFTYHLRIDYTTQLPEAGTIVTNHRAASVLNCKRKLNGYEFDLKIDSNAKRLTVFNLSFRSSNNKTSDPIACEVTETGSFYSMVLQDTTNTTFAGLLDKTTYYTFHFTHGTGARVWSFYGKDLGHARLDSSAIGKTILGLQLLADLTNVHDTLFELVFSVGDTVTDRKGSLRDDILSHVYDRSADRCYPWITYANSAAIPESRFTDNQEGVTADPGFELTPGNRQTLCSTCKGYHRFLHTLFKVD